MFNFMYIFEISYLEFIKKTSISKKHTLIAKYHRKNLNNRSNAYGFMANNLVLFCWTGLYVDRILDFVASWQVYYISII